MKLNFKSKKVGILGGTFNPIHNGHIKISELAKNTKLESFNKKNDVDQNDNYLDEVWIVPTYLTSLKDSAQLENITPNDRFQMIKKSIPKNNKKWLKLKKIELNQRDVNYTWDTFYKLNKLYPKIKFYLILGSDSFIKIDKWYNYKDLVNLINIIVIERDGIDLESIANEKMITYIKAEPIDISSTLIREGKSSEMAESAWKYLAKNNLYLNNIVKTKILKDNIKIVNEENRNLYNHILEVANLSRRISKYNNLSSNKTWQIYCCSLLHDLTKFKSKNWHIKYLKSFLDIKNDEIFLVHDNVLHAYSAAYWFSNDYNSNNTKMFNAIKFHTTGRPKMNIMEKIVYLSDKIGKIKNNDEKEYFLELTKKNMNGVLTYFIEKSHLKLEKKKITPSEISKAAYDFYMKKNKKNLIVTKDLINNFKQVKKKDGEKKSN